MADVTVTVKGVKETTEAILRSMDRVVLGIKKYAKSSQAPFEQRLKATIQHVVYDAYAPREYRRNLNLIQAVASEYREGANVIEMEFYNDDSRVSLRGGDVSAGGSRKSDVPLEIEEGRYPAGRGRGWLGFTAPRPAYAMFGASIVPEIDAALHDIIIKSFR